MTYVVTLYLSPASRWWGQGALLDVRWAMIPAVITILAILIHRRKEPPAPFFSLTPVIALAVFVLWLLVQSLWALDPDMHTELWTMYAKFLVVIFMILRCVDSEEHMKWFLWSHIGGCMYLGYIAWSSYGGGRFDSFGGAGLDDANAGGLAIVTAILTAASMFLASGARSKVALVLVMPILVNGMVATISRSAFLGAAVGGLAFNYYCPVIYRARVRVLSVMGVVLVLLLTNPVYWERMASIKHAGEQVENVNTGEDRLAIIGAQWRMFQSHPLGCGHRCTAVLSPSYLEDKYLTSDSGGRVRSSHNTFMTLLVEQGVPGAAFYIAMLLWMWVAFHRLWRGFSETKSSAATLYPAVASTLLAIAVGDMFVDYLKFEVRIWFVGIVLVLLHWQNTGRDTKMSGALLPD